GAQGDDDNQQNNGENAATIARGARLVLNATAWLCISLVSRAGFPPARNYCGRQAIIVIAFCNDRADTLVVIITHKWMVPTEKSRPLYTHAVGVNTAAIPR